MNSRPWINNELPHAFELQMLFMYLPIAVVLLINIVLILQSSHLQFVYMRISCKSKGETIHSSILIRCILYSLYLFIIFRYVVVSLMAVGWSCFDRVFTFITKKTFSFPFDIISFTVPLLVGLWWQCDFQGFMNVCAYSLNKFFFSSFKRPHQESVMDGNGLLMEETIPFAVAVNVNQNCISCFVCTVVEISRYEDKRQTLLSFLPTMIYISETHYSQ